jgi:hypothetical protein
MLFLQGNTFFYQPSFQRLGNWEQGDAMDFADASGIACEEQQGGSDGDYWELPDPIASYEGKVGEGLPKELSNHLTQPVTMLCEGNTWKYEVYPLEFEDDE